jgi:hypothetical protein
MKEKKEASEAEDEEIGDVKKEYESEEEVMPVPPSPKKKISSPAKGKTKQIRRQPKDKKASQAVPPSLPKK